MNSKKDQTNNNGIEFIVFYLFPHFEFSQPILSNYYLIEKEHCLLIMQPNIQLTIWKPGPSSAFNTDDFNL